MSSVILDPASAVLSEIFDFEIRSKGEHITVKKRNEL